MNFLNTVEEREYVALGVSTTKRLIDILVSLFGLILTAVLWPFIALAIKFESPGPILFRQLRIGQCCADRTKLFEMIKFRTMAMDAEKSGAQWAQKKDTRITRVGNFLRKTRLDELPQFYNVLAGDMSLIGPRPERPGFYRKLEKAIPLYCERTYGLKPGITGLAQVNQGYDTCLDDVRSKLLYDHAYAICLSDFRAWLNMDLEITYKTVIVMVMGRGQ
jgi:lipopolysaccharide/colanic/teichoic acid biosynthesis glycosyltransferase